ncbi:MAG: TIGR01212 family radical SAM protein [Planctomycetes bacterium]|nr:TIGR01212 family radical SAM protein [Planctomycetota bacterium]
MLFYSFKNYLKDRFPGLKVYKIALDAGFTCPHRSSDTRTGGCIYCENRSFSPYARLPIRPPISEQIAKAMDFYRQRHKADKFIIYFQAYTNTLGPVDKLKALYDEALAHPDIVGLSIGTRPDCVPDKTLDLITGYTKKYDVWLEYGLQSAHDKTLEFINRGHKYADFEDAVKRTKGRNISIAAHLILGLPNETRDDMLQSVQKVIDFGVDGIKLHHLYVAQNTQLAKMHKEAPIKLLTLEEYIPLVCDTIERLPPKMVLMRLTGELSGELLIAPKWGVSKSAIIRMIEEELTKRGSYQGKKYPF